MQCNFISSHGLCTSKLTLNFNNPKNLIIDLQNLTYSCQDGHIHHYTYQQLDDEKKNGIAKILSQEGVSLLKRPNLGEQLNNNLTMVCPIFIKNIVCKEELMLLRIGHTNQSGNKIADWTNLIYRCTHGHKFKRNFAYLLPQEKDSINSMSEEELKMLMLIRPH